MANVLIVEDNEYHQQILAETLKFKGHNVKCACNGKEGIDELVKSEKTDIIFSDYNMPVMDGYEFSKSVRTNQNYSKIPIIGTGDFPRNKQEYLTEYVTKVSMKFLSNALECIDNYCK
jgi:CheY-like chemotaxis protein